MMASLLFGLASATTSNSAGNMARAYIGTLRLNVSDNSYATADSVLPFFKFQNSGNEGGIGFAFLVAMPACDLLAASPSRPAGGNAAKTLFIPLSDGAERGENQRKSGGA